MGNRSASLGAQAERDAAALLSEWLGVAARRMLGAGRKDDVGDIAGVRGFTIQVARRGNLGEVLRHKAKACETQQLNGDTQFGVTLMKLPPLPGGKPPEWRFVMTPDQFAEVYDALRSNGIIR